MSKTAIVFGAGATKACAGPLTDEILPWAFGPFRRRASADPGWDDTFKRDGMIDHVVRGFLEKVFDVDVNRAAKEDFQPLPLLLSLLLCAGCRSICRLLSRLFLSIFPSVRLIAFLGARRFATGMSFPALFCTRLSRGGMLF